MRALKVTRFNNGRLHHTGMGRPHAHTPPVVMVNADLDLRITDTTTGELLRHLTLDYQPTGRPPNNDKTRTR